MTHLDEHDDRPLAGPLPEVPVPSHLESRVVAALRAAGRLHPPRRHRWRQIAAAVALVALGAAGATAFRPQPAGSRGDSTAGPRYLFLLYPGANAAADAAAELALVAAYGAWARGASEAGHAVTGERLANGSGVLVTASATSPSPDADAPEGFFIVSARTRDEAVALAQASPHARHGGRIVVRQIDTP